MNWKIIVFTGTFLITGVSGVIGDSLDGSLDNSTADSMWSEFPNYEMIFPDDAVQEILITITPENWQLMQDDLHEKYGGERGGMMQPPADLQIGNLREGEARRVHVGGGFMMNQEDPIYVEASVTYNNKTWNHTGVRYKGFSSLQGAVREDSGKISLKLKMDYYKKEYPETKGQTLYGFEELNLQSNYGDKSLIRDKIVPEIFQDAGVVAPETAFYRVYIDYGEGPQYFGLYTMIEAVEDTVIATQFSDDSGNLYKPESMGGLRQGFNESGDLQASPDTQKGSTFAKGTLDLESFNKRTNEKAADYSDIEALYEVLHSDERHTDPEAWRAELESVFYVDEFIRWLATNTLIQNGDTYGGNNRNYYLYNDPESGTFFWIPWDNNFAMMQGMGVRAFAFNGTDQPPRMEQGGFQPPGFPEVGDRFPPQEGMFERDGGFGMGGLSLNMEGVGDNWPLISFLMGDPTYKALYNQYLEEVATEVFYPEAMIKKYMHYHDLIEPYVVGENGEREGYSYLQSDTDFDAAFEELTTHVQERYDAAMEYLKTVA